MWRNIFGSGEAAPAAPAAPVRNTEFFTELHNFFNEAVINFDGKALEQYNTRIISSLSVLPSYRRLQLFAAPVQIGTRQRDPIIALECIFTRDTRVAFRDNPIKCHEIPPKCYLENNVLISEHITEFPIRLQSLASAYYQIEGSPEKITDSNITPISGSVFRVTYTPDQKEIIPLWIPFLEECLQFKQAFGFFPPQVFHKLMTYTGRNPLECPDTAYRSMIDKIPAFMIVSGGKRKRSTRIRRSRHRIRSRRNKSTRKYISNT